MMPRTKDGDWFWDCQDNPKCQGRTTKSRRSSQKERLDEPEECLEQGHQQIGPTKVEVWAAAALLEEATKREEGKWKALARAANTKLASLVMTHLEVAKNLLSEEKARSQAAGRRPSPSD